MSNKPNVQLEIALVKIARALFDYTDAQNDPKELSVLNKIWGDFESVVGDYHNATGRLHPDLCYDPGEWATLKREALEAVAKKQEVSLPGPLHVYRESALNTIETSEQDLELLT